MGAGRNEPCPCGSGLKHKRCCGAAKPTPGTVASDSLAKIEPEMREAFAAAFDKTFPTRGDLRGEYVDRMWRRLQLRAKGADLGRCDMLMGKRVIDIYPEDHEEIFMELGL